MNNEYDEFEERLVRQQFYPEDTKERKDSEWAHDLQKVMVLDALDELRHEWCLLPVDALNILGAVFYAAREDLLLKIKGIMEEKDYQRLLQELENYYGEVFDTYDK